MSSKQARIEHVNLPATFSTTNQNDERHAKPNISSACTGGDWLIDKTYTAGSEACASQ